MSVLRCFPALLVAFLALSVSEAKASGRGAMPAPGVTYYAWPGPVGGMGLPHYTPGVTYGSMLPAYPYYVPYIAPYPGYGVIPPPFATWQMLGYDREGRRRDEVESDPLGYIPRKRPVLSPAVPFQPAPDASVERRRVTFEIIVPTDAAVVLFDGVQTKQTGRTRVFVTPPVQEDRLYEMTIEVHWTDGTGKARMARETKQVVAGEMVRMTIK